jgi:hypothetical protein
MRKAPGHNRIHSHMNHHGDSVMFSVVVGVQSRFASWWHGVCLCHYMEVFGLL